MPVAISHGTAMIAMMYVIGPSLIRRDARASNSTIRVKAYPMLPLKMLRVLPVEHRNLRAQDRTRAPTEADAPQRETAPGLRSEAVPQFHRLR
jgi:hypothetical protein